jgi:hypothetical protein
MLTYRVDALTLWSNLLTVVAGGDGAVREVEYHGGYTPSWNRWVFLEEIALRGAGVTDCRWYCAVNMPMRIFVLCREWVDVICCALVGGRPRRQVVVSLSM